MVRQDFHIHSSFSDGDSTPEQIVQQAIAQGLERIGFSDHVHAKYDPDCSMKREDIPLYHKTIRALREKYAGQIDIFCGIEQDFYADDPPVGYDYVIGSVHTLMLGGKYYDVDYRVESMYQAAQEQFGGDMYGVVEAYYDTVSRVCEQTGCDVIGHFDLVAKLNDRYHLFDENHPRYIAAWQKAADILLKTGKVFEINTGGIYGGYRTQPYPTCEIMQYLARHGAEFILSSDSHYRAALGFDFDKWEQTAKRLHIPLTVLTNEVIR